MTSSAKSERSRSSLAISSWIIFCRRRTRSRLRGMRERAFGQRECFFFFSSFNHPLSPYLFLQYHPARPEAMQT